MSAIPVTNPAPARPKRTLTYNQLTSCPDMEPAFVEAFERCRAFTMTSLERMYAVWQAVEYIARRDVPGDVVECGVWKGGCAMVAAIAMRHFNVTRRNLWLYDTFEGMPMPERRDRDYDGRPAAERYQADWCRCSLEEVKANLRAIGVDLAQVHFVVGQVEQTLLQVVPEQIAILRLDTDWYTSTRAEMEHLFPKLVGGGTLIVDDYGHWQGCREAVDEYLGMHRIPMLLCRTDYTGRIGIKP